MNLSGPTVHLKFLKFEMLRYIYPKRVQKDIYDMTESDLY